MTVKNKEGREIEITEMEGEFNEGVYCVQGYYIDTGEEITEQDLDYITDSYQSDLYDHWYQDRVCQAEYCYEGDR